MPRRWTVALVSMCLSSPAAAQLVWRKATHETRPSSAIAYDHARARVVMVGGYQDGAAETWEWDGRAWIGRSVGTPRPASVYDHGFAPGPNGTAVLFGGNGGDDETWVWDGYRWSQPPLVQWPPGRWEGTMSFDRARQRVVLFSGRGAADYLPDLWEWDGVRWWQRAPTTSPGARRAHAMAYDESRQVTLMLGGFDRRGPAPAEMWAWDGTNWTRLTPTTLPPLGAVGMAYDSARDRTILVTRNGTTMETWEWDGSSWQLRTPATALPLVTAPGLAFDASRRRTVLVDSAEPDTWEWDGVDWQRVARPPRPENRGYARFEVPEIVAYDAARGRTVVFDPEDATTAAWEWDGVRWWRHTTAPRPALDSGIAMVYDAARQRTVLFGGWANGGYVAQTWEWDGRAWAQRTPSTSPSPRWIGSLAYDAGRARVVLFGGATQTPLDDTWEWDGTTWTRIATPFPPTASRAARLAYDAARRRTVLFDGTTAGRTWEWDGVTWFPISSASGPVGAIDPAIAFDPRRGHVVLFGGGRDALDGSATNLDEQWEWDGSNWTQIRPAALPRPRRGAGMVFDARRQRLVLVGGYFKIFHGQVTDLTDVWELGPTALAHATAYGHGCAGSGGSAALSAAGSPYLGNGSFGFDVTGVPAHAPALLTLAREPAALALGGGCAVLLRPPLLGLPAPVDATGRATVTVVIPDDPTLLGASAFTQGIAWDPGSSWGGGLVFTNGLQLGLGER